MKPKKWLPGPPFPFYCLLLPWGLAFVMALGKAPAQSPKPPRRVLAVGQAVPNLVLTNLVNHPTATAKLSDFRGKLLILDFWATWCGSCIKAMPKLEALQAQFPDQLQVLLVNARSTRDTEAKVRAFYEKHRNPEGQRFRLPTVAEDTVLDKLFPHKLIPHYVWVGPDGRVKAITASDELTPENVRRVLAKDSPVLQEKKDVSLQRPLFAGADLPAAQLLHYAILLQGNIPGLPGGTKLRRSGDTVQGIALTNTPLLDMYKRAALALHPELGEKRFTLEVADLSPLLPAASPLPKADWNREHPLLL